MDHFFVCLLHMKNLTLTERLVRDIHEQNEKFYN